MEKQEILERLNPLDYYRRFVPSLKENGREEASGLCPFHDDRTPSLSVNLKTGLFHCFGCQAGGDVVAFHQRLKGVSFQDALKEIGHMVGLNGDPVKQEVVGVFKYRNETGQVVYRKERIQPGRNGQRKEFLFYHTEDGKKVPGRGEDSIPYNLPGIMTVDGPVYFVEGEGKADLLNQWGLTATCFDAGSGSPWRSEYLRYFEDKEVIFFPDNDEPGRIFVKRIAGALDGHVKSIKVVGLPGLPVKGDILNWVKESGNTKEKLLSIVETSPFWKLDQPMMDSPFQKDPKQPLPLMECEVWEDPIPFNDYSLLPDFPLQALIPWGREMVESVANVTQVDPGLPGVIFLSILSAALAGKGEVNLLTHKEPLNEYFCSVLPPGERKTQALKLMSAPIYEYEKIIQGDMAVQIRECVNRQKIDELRLSQLQKDASKANDPTERQQLEAEAAIIAKKIQDAPVPKPPYFLGDNVTVEALGNVMADNGEKLAIISSEAGIFSIMAGQYNKKASESLDLFLKAHSGDPCSVHRVGREGYSMQAPALTLSVTVQPSVITEIGQNKEFSGRGLLARFLFYMGNPKAGYRPRQSKTLPDTLLASYRNHLFGLLGLSSITRTLIFSNEAQALWDEFYNDVETELRPGGSLEDLKDFGSKLPGAVARIAGLLHYAEFGNQGPEIPISIEIVQGACVLGGFFKEHALAVLDLMHLNPAIESAKKILRYLDHHKPTTFKGRDLLTNIVSLKTMDDANVGLNFMLERNFIKEAPKKYEGKGRPEAMIYTVNPMFYEISSRQNIRL